MERRLGAADLHGSIINFLIAAIERFIDDVDVRTGIDLYNCPPLIKARRACLVDQENVLLAR